MTKRVNVTIQKKRYKGFRDAKEKKTAKGGKAKIQKNILKVKLPFEQLYSLLKL